MIKEFLPIIDETKNKIFEIADKYSIKRCNLLEEFAQIMYSMSQNSTWDKLEEYKHPVHKKKR